MANNRTLTAVILLSILMAKSHTRGDKDAETLNQNQASMIEKLTEYREESFLEDSNVTLLCGNTTKVQWNEFIYIVWNISMHGRKCYLGLSPNTDDTCHDGKMLRNSSDGVSLFIPKISVKDEGFYSCDLSYKGGGSSVNVSVSVTQISTHLDNENGQTVAVCKARYKNKAPTLHWEPAFNFSLKNTSFKNDGTSLEIRLYLDDNVAFSNLTCVATYPSFISEVRKTLYLKDGSAQPPFRWEIIIIPVSLVFVITLSLAVVYGLRKKLHNLSGKMLCCKPKIPTPAEDKPPQPPDDEEVQPYASYVQRENSIYNSSAELYNA